MPIYEYTCQECGHHFDKMRPMSQSNAPIACAKCSSIATKRLVSRFFAASEGRAIATQSSCSCEGCGGGSCSSCGSHNN